MNLPMKSQSTFHGYGIFLVIHLICFSFIRRICEVLQTSSTAKPLKESTAFRAKSVSNARNPIFPRYSK
jgi:hypothetical protein